MISIIKTPYPCSLSKNAIYFVVQSDMYFTAPRIYPSAVITMINNPVPTSTYEFRWINPENDEVESIHFVVGATASYAQLEILPDFGGLYTEQAYRNVLFDKLLAYEPFNAWFDVEKLGTDQINIAGKLADTRLNLEFITNSVTGSILFANNYAAVEPTVRNGYFATATIFIESVYGSGDYNRVTSTDIVLNENAQGSIDLSEVLNSAIEDAWEQYPMPVNSIEFSDNLRRYYVEFDESWSAESRIFTTRSGVLHVHWGGVSSDDEVMNAPLSSIASTQQWLTWWPSGKRLDVKQNDWLSFMNTREARTLKVLRTIYSTTGDLEQTIYNATVPQWRTIVLPVGHDQTNLPNEVLATDVIYKWTYQVVDQENYPVSPLFTYYAERTICRKHILLFRNSFGMPETFYTSGEWTESMNVTTEIANRSKSFNINGRMPKSFVFDSTHQLSYNALTGVLNNLEAERLQPLLNTTICYLYEKSRLRPVIVATDSVDYLDRTNYIQRLPVKLLAANYSDRSSFFGYVPQLEVVVSAGISAVQIVEDSAPITSASSLTVTRNGISVGTYTYLSGSWIISPALTVEGAYIFNGTVNGIAIERVFAYVQERASGIMNFTGVDGFSLRSANPSESISVDWGDGNGFIMESYTDTITMISHDYGTMTGNKFVTMKKPSMLDIVEFSASSVTFDELEISQMKNLERISLLGAVTNRVYFSKFSKLQRIYVQNSLVSYVQVGFQRDLEILSLSNLALTSSTLDQLMLELWEYREMYALVPQVYLQTLGFSPSALTLSIINGTGKYTGQGLVPDYGWTVLIF